MKNRLIEIEISALDISCAIRLYPITCSVKSLTRVSRFDYLVRITAAYALQWLVIAYRTRVYNLRVSRGVTSHNRPRSHARNSVARCNGSFVHFRDYPLSRARVLPGSINMQLDRATLEHLQVSTFPISVKYPGPPSTN